MNKNDLDALLRTWASVVIRELDQGFQAESIMQKIIETGGIIIRSHNIPTPDIRYNRALYKLNLVILNLETEDRNLIVMKRILGSSYQEIGKEYKLTKWGIMRRMEKVECNIMKSLH